MKTMTYCERVLAAMATTSMWTVPSLVNASRMSPRSIRATGVSRARASAGGLRPTDAQKVSHVKLRLGRLVLEVSAHGARPARPAAVGHAVRARRPREMKRAGWYVVARLAEGVHGAGV